MNPFETLGLAKIRASELKSCFYCDNPLPSKSKEHLFSACYGGTHKSSRLICDSCNEAFARIDPALTQYSYIVMNAWGFKGDRHGEIPVIPLEGNLELGPFASPRLKNAEISTTPQEDGRHAIKVSAGSKGAARRMLFDGDAIDESIGRPLSEDEKDRFREQIRAAETTPSEVGPAAYKVSLNFHEEYRIAAHTILKCAALYDPNLVSDAITKPVRDFARYGIGEFPAFAVVTKENLPTIHQIKRALGVMQNTVLIYWSRTERKIIGVFHLLGRVQRSVVLVDDYPGPEAFLCLYEPVRGSPAPRAMFAQLRPTGVPAPLIEIVSRPPSASQLIEDLADLGQHCMVDSIQARMLNELDKLNARGPVDACAASAVEQVLAQALTELARANKQKLSVEDATALLTRTKGGLELAPFAGQQISSEPVQSAIAELFKRAANALMVDEPNRGI